MKTGIWINIVKQPLNGHFHSDLKSFIVSSLSFWGSSAYFFCYSSTFGWILLIHCVILFDAADDLYINHLTSNVSATIAIQSCHPEIAKNITRILNTGRYNISVTNIFQIFITYIDRNKIWFLLNFHYFFTFSLYQVIDFCIHFLS